MFGFRYLAPPGNEAREYISHSPEKEGFRGISNSRLSLATLVILDKLDDRNRTLYGSYDVTTS